PSAHLFVSCSGPPPPLPSFPTRRSSDLASIERAREAYNGEDKAMGLITSAGDIGYSAPSVGRTVGPVFDILDLNPALEDVKDRSDRKSTRLNSSHVSISYAVFCLKKKKT